MTDLLWALLVVNLSRLAAIVAAGAIAYAGKPWWVWGSFLLVGLCVGATEVSLKRTGVKE